MEKLKTGTTTVGVKCKDGVVLAADRRATAGNMIVGKDVDKVFKISDNLALTMAGSVSDLQLNIKLIKAELQIKRLRTHREPNVKEAANLLAGMVYRGIRSMGSITHFLVGGKENGDYGLYDIYPDGSVSEIKDFISSGSGSVFAVGVLETQYKENMSIDEAKKLVRDAINTAIQRDSASGGGYTLFTVTKDGVKQEVDETIEVTLK